MERMRVKAQNKRLREEEILEKAEGNAIKAKTDAGEVT